MYISQTQCFLIVALFTAAIGVRRGWGREVITCAIILGTVLFLSNGGALVLADWLTKLQCSLTSLFSGGSNSTPVFGVNAQALSSVVFVGMTTVGYIAGGKWGHAPTSHNHRVAGIIPGAINGAALVFYTSTSILSGRQVFVNSPTPSSAGPELAGIVGLALVGLVVVLFIAGQAKK